MKIAIVGPSPVPYCRGGIENFLTGLQKAINESTCHVAELIKIPIRENTVPSLIAGYIRCRLIDLDHFDLIVSFKYPTWMIRHRNHIIYLGHRLRGLYDTYPIPPQRDRLLASNPLDFPGPWIRNLIHWLDDRAIRPERISHAFSMSRTIADRPGYFHPELTPRVICGSSFRDDFRSEPGEHFFTVNRMDAPKRIDLMIRAFRHVRTDRPFIIAGTGPQEDYLRALAGSDPRIVFPGEVSETRLLELYARAYAVVYTPYQEDYGLITIEGMKSGKPIVVTSDSGGPIEFIEHGVNGLIAAPDEHSLAVSIQTLADDPALVERMGFAALERMKTVTWEHAVKALLEPYRFWPDRSSRTRKQRRRVTVLIPYPIHPVRSGGQRRESALYVELSRFYDVFLLTLGRDRQSGNQFEINPNLHEICIPPSESQLREQWQLEAEAGTAISDVAIPRLMRKNHNFIRAIDYFSEASDIVVSCHPYMHRFIRPSARTQLIVHESQNFEWLMKSTYLSGTQIGRSLLKDVYRAEKEAYRSSHIVFTTGPEEARRMSAEYGAPKGLLGYVPNGVDVERFRPATSVEREAARAEMGWKDRTVVLFMGAWHPPNLEALIFIRDKLAPQLHELLFVVVGSVRDHYEASHGPFPPAENIHLTGAVDEPTLLTILAGVDLAINPMFTGAGTNLKVLEYFACGIPVVSTPHGIRGLDVKENKDVRVADADRFADTIRSLAVSSGLKRDLRESARQTVVSTYAWRTIGARMTALIESAIPPAGPTELELDLDAEFRMGWYHLEFWEIPGRTSPLKVRWSFPECCVFVPDLRHDFSVELSVQGAPDGSNIAIMVDSQVVFEGVIASSFQNIHVPVASKPGMDWRLLTLRTPGWSPVQFGSPDTRRLGVAVSRIAVSREQQ